MRKEGGKEGRQEGRKAGRKEEWKEGREGRDRQKSPNENEEDAKIEREREREHKRKGQVRTGRNTIEWNRTYKNQTERKGSAYKRKAGEGNTNKT